MRVNQNYAFSPYFPKSTQNNQEKSQLLSKLKKDESSLIDLNTKESANKSKITLQMGAQSPEDGDFAKDPLQKQKDEFKAKSQEKDKQDSLKFEQMDAQVRAHEAAHLAASGGQAAGGASFSYVKGPDGKMYANAGEVPVALRAGSTPQETINNSQSVMAAALAPADPSAQDLQVAARAARMQAKAREMLAKNNENPLKDEPNKQNERAKTQSISGLKPLDSKALNAYLGAKDKNSLNLA